MGECDPAGGADGWERRAMEGRWQNAVARRLGKRNASRGHMAPASPRDPRPLRRASLSSTHTLPFSHVAHTPPSPLVVWLASAWESPSSAAESETSVLPATSLPPPELLPDPLPDARRTGAAAGRAPLPSCHSRSSSRCHRLRPGGGSRVDGRTRSRQVTHPRSKTQHERS